MPDARDAQPIGRETLIDRAARALAADPRVIASALSAYQRQTGTSEPDLAAWLRLTPAGLHALALCARPDPSDLGYAHLVVATAQYAGCDAARLRLLLDAVMPALDAPPSRSAAGEHGCAEGSSPSSEQSPS